MLLSRQALPGFDPGGPGVPPVAAAVASSFVGPPAPRLVGELGTGLPFDEGDPGIPPREWVEDATDSIKAVILLESESGEVRSSLDETGTDGLAGAGDEAVPADAPDPMSAPGDEDSAEEIIYEGLDGLDAIPWQAEYTVAGSLDSARAHIAYRIPVGPGTNSLRLAIHSGQSGSGTPPLIDKLYLVDPAGDILAQITSAPIDGGDGSRLMVTLQGAPEGSHLVVGLAMRDVQLPTAPEVVSDPGGGFDGEPPPLPSPPQITFELNVQRNDPEPQPPNEGGGGSPDSSLPTPLPAPPITAPPARVGAGSIGWSVTQTTRLIFDGLVRVDRGMSTGGRGSTSAFSWTEMGRSAGGRAPSVYLGPLVSRGAAPLGPTLATPVDEPTQPIDRENLAVDEALDRIGTELDSGLLAGLKHRDDAAVPATATRAIPGAGGLPILVSATSRARGRAEADALTANLQSRSVEEALTAEIPEAPLTTDPGGEDVRIASAGMLTRAAGLVIGLGLATGPLYPDLVALARRKLARGKTSIIKRRWFFRGRPTRPVF